MNYTYGDKNEYAIGTLVTERVSATAGNVDTDLTPGSDVRWRLLYGFMQITTDATAATRQISLKITDGSNTLAILGGTASISASKTGSLTLAGVGGLTNDFTPGLTSSPDSYGQVDPNSLIIEGDDTFNISVSSGQAGDSYNGRFRFMAYDL